MSVLPDAQSVRAYLRFAAPSLLAPENLPKLARSHAVACSIYTTRPGAEAIEAAPIVRQMMAAIDVRVSPLPGHVTLTADKTVDGVLAARGLDVARRNRELMVRIAANALYGADALSRWVRRVEQGYRAVYAPSPAIVLETAAAEIDKRYPDQDAVLAIDDASLQDIFLRHMHPLVAAMERTSPRHAGEAGCDMRFVAGRGIVLRALYANPVCIDPAYFNALDGLKPLDHFDKLAFEPISVLSLEPLYKGMSPYYRPEPLGAAELTQTGLWLQSVGAKSGRESRHAYAVAFRDDDSWRNGRDRAVAAGRFFCAQLDAASLCASLFRGLVVHDLTNAAHFLAAALFAARAPRLITLRGDETLLAPSDGAFAGEDGAWAWRLIADGKTREVAQLLREHIVFTDTGGVARTLNGRSVEDVAGRIDVSDVPLSVAGFKVYTVNRIIRPLAASAAASHVINARRRRAAMPARLQILAAPADPFRPTRAAERLALPAFVPASRRRAFTLWRRNAARKSAGQAVWWLLNRNRNRMRRAFLLLAAVPGLRGPAAVGERAVDYVFRHGLGATVARIRAELTMSRKNGTPPHDEAAARHADQAPRADQSPVADAASANDKSIAVIIGSVRLLRGLDVVEEVLDRYHEHVLAGALTSAPLALVRSLRRAWLGAANDEQAIEASLRKLIARHPDCAEAHAELGYLLRDRGRAAEAKTSFAAASRGACYDPSTGDARAWAALALGVLLADEGDLAAAADAYGHAVSLQAPPSGARVRYGDVLRRRGDIDAARTQYALAMDGAPAHWPFPAVDGAADELSIDLAPDGVTA